MDLDRFPCKSAIAFPSITKQLHISWHSIIDDDPFLLQSVSTPFLWVEDPIFLRPRWITNGTPCQMSHGRKPQKDELLVSGWGSTHFHTSSLITMATSWNFDRAEFDSTQIFLEPARLFKIFFGSCRWLQWFVATSRWPGVSTQKYYGASLSKYQLEQDHECDHELERLARLVCFWSASTYASLEEWCSNVCGLEIFQSSHFPLEGIFPNNFSL